MADEDVRVSFGAKIDGLIAGVDAVKGKIEGMGDAAHGIIDTFTGVGEAIAVAFSVDKIKDWVHETTEAGSHMRQLQEQLGTTAEQFNILRVATENSDSKMDALARSFGVFSRNLVQTKDATSGASAAFRAMGIDVQGLLKSGHSYNDIMEMTIKKLAGYKNSQEKAALVAELFGGRSAALIETLNKLGNSHEELAEIVKRTGANVEGFSDAAASTKDKTVELDIATQTLSQRLYVALKPAIDAVIEGLTDSAEKLGRNKKAFEDIKISVEATILALRALWNVITQTFSFLTTTLENVALAIGNVGTTLGLLAQGKFKEIAVEYEKTMKAINENTRTYLRQSVEEWRKWAADVRAVQKMAVMGAGLLKPQGKTEGGDKAGGGTPAPSLGDFFDKSKELMNEDIANHRAMLDLELAQAGDNLEKKKQLYQNFYNWLKQKYPQNTRAIAEAAAQEQRIVNQQVKQTEERWGHFFQSFNQGIMGMLNRTMTVRQALGNILSGMANLWLKNIEKIVAKWIAGEATKTAATTAGNAARTASDSAAAAASGGFSAAKVIKEITGDAARAYSGTYGFLAPAMGPFAAIPAAGAFAAVMAMEALVPSFDVGTNFVTHDMVAKIHAGERILTASENERFSKGGGSGGITLQINGGINDARSIRDMLMREGPTIARTMQRQSTLSHKTIKDKT